MPGLPRDGAQPVPLPVAVNADSLATWFAPAAAAFAADAPVLLQVAVDDQDPTAEWLRSGAVLAAVLAAVTAAVAAQARPPAGCSSRPLGAMRYVATACPAFVRRHFAQGVGAASLARAQPALQRSGRAACALGAAALPPSRGTAAAHTAVGAGLRHRGAGRHGLGLQPLARVAGPLKDGALVELVPRTPLDVPLHWQYARAASATVDALGRAVHTAARAALRPG